MNKYLAELYATVCAQFDQQASLISGIIIGMIIISIYDRLIGNKRLIDSYDVVIKAKDEHINTLKTAIGEKLKQVVVDKKDQNFFNNIKRYFAGK